jgi:hypothetical protein
MAFSETLLHTIGAKPSNFFIVKVSVQFLAIAAQEHTQIQFVKGQETEKL